MIRMMQQLSKRERALALAVAGFVLLMGLYHLIVAPLAGFSDRLDQKIRITEAKMMKSLRLTHQAAHINAEFDRLAPLHQFRGTDEEMISALLRSIEALARTSSVTITDIKPQPGQEGPNQRKFFIEMDAEAAMPSLFGFLQGMETSPELFCVQKMSITPRGVDSKTLRAHILVSRILWT